MQNKKVLKIKIVFPEHPYFWGIPNGWPGIVVRELPVGKIISKCVMTKLEK